LLSSLRKPDLARCISVVICAHTMDRIDELRASIRSVLRQGTPAFELITVCDHNEQLQALVAKEFPTITVMANAETRGLSGARNTGIKAASGTVIAFIDDDAQASEDWLARLWQPYSDPGVIAVGGGIVPNWPGQRPRWFPSEFDWVIGCSYIGQPETGGPVRNLIGCNMSIRRDVAQAVGDFRTALGRVGDNGAGCEETDYFIRARELYPDRVVYLLPDAVVHHSISPARTTWRYYLQRCRAEGKAKAALVGLVGSETGLSSETSYARSILPAGVLHGIWSGFSGDLGGFARAYAICAGFYAVASAYLIARLKLKKETAPIASDFRPYRIVDADLAGGLPKLHCRDEETGEPLSAAWCLVRSNGQPIKILEVPFDSEDISPDAFADLIAADPTEVPAPPLELSRDGKLPTISVIIATRNRAESLIRCLDSLFAQTFSDFEIVVVDNAPSDSSTADLIADRYAPTGRARYVLEKIPGLGRAHNTGVAHAQGAILAFTDDDVIVDPNWISSIVANFASSERIGCVTGMILPAELRTRAQVWTESHGGFGKGLHRRLFDINDKSRFGPLFPYAAGAFGSGANMAFRRDALEKMGGFDNALGAGTVARGGDDIASFVAVLQAGYQLAYEPGAMVWHHHRREEEGMRRQAYGYGIGLGAFLTKQILEKPSTLLFFARRFPQAFMHMFSKKSEKLARLPDDYPRNLVWTERWGILVGVPSYIRSRLKERPASIRQIGAVVGARR
jgi:GT2 family glycosyltransferase